MTIKGKDHISQLINQLIPFYSLAPSGECIPCILYHAEFLSLSDIRSLLIQIFLHFKFIPINFTFVHATKHTILSHSLHVIKPLKMLYCTFCSSGTSVPHCLYICSSLNLSLIVTPQAPLKYRISPLPSTVISDHCSTSMSCYHIQL